MQINTWPVRLIGAIVVWKSFKLRSRHSTVREHGARGDDVSCDVTDDAVGVGVADWLLTELWVGVVSNGEECSVDVYEVFVWTWKSPPYRCLGHALCQWKTVCHTQYMHITYLLTYWHLRHDAIVSLPVHLTSRIVGRAGGDGVSKHPHQLRSSAVFHISLHFRILKMINTSGFLTALDGTNFDFGRCSATDPAVGAYSAPQTP